MTVKRVIFIRPGETDWNREGRWQGWVAAPLNVHGRRQAQALANYVRNIGLSALYTSDLRRALETAETLAERLGFEPIPDERLRERNIGLWQGLTLEEMKAWYPEQYAALKQDAENFKIPGGESRADVRKRVRAAFRDFIKADLGETIAILSHTTAIKALLNDLIPSYDPLSSDIGNTSVTTIARQQDGSWVLVADNDISHLEGIETQAVPELEEGL